MLEGNIILPYPLLINTHAIGCQFPVIIGGYGGTVGLPRIDKSIDYDNGFHDFLLPPLDDQIKKLDSDEEENWGRVWDWPEGRVEVKAFKIWFPLVNITKGKEIGQTITDAFDNWFESFLDYLQIFSFAIIGDPGSVESNPYSSGKKITLFFRNADNKLTIGYLKKEPRKITVHITSGIRKEELALAFEASSYSKKIPLEYSLMLDSIKALLFAQDYRKAVLDAATALEVAITERIKNELDTYANPNPKFVSSILNKYQTLGNRLQLAQILNISLPTVNYKGESINYEVDIVRLRNQAVHFGETPSESEADKAVRVVEEAVRQLNPIT
ncbi:hypothetical protein GXP67_30955 [Rhodocytophaga rosea]|uniref:Apea-like HEPN domain-containing protein n=1 Tax=Rhodocytophaga rosea TaxID=2704465 RepID=A0A6C0GSI9_9BACT|nr:hypothetical protein [Rhodocytophaga rosea]QHT70754.1 hypothetical protein GXP67_30955 [Rhodocytophaga rosea]